MAKLDKKFYLGEDVVLIARQLLGKFLCTHFNGMQTSGIIIETEAYKGPQDRASHAYGGRKTPRNAVMYQEGGVAYVYTCYGIHSLFNVVTHCEGVPHAVLIRALLPVEGVQYMRQRRPKAPLSAGPGTLSQALGIRSSHSGISLLSDTIWLEDRGIFPEKICSGPRIGIDYAGPDAKLPWRFRVSNNSFCNQSGS